MEGLWQDARYAARMLTKNPGFTAIALIVLALGIGANTAMFTLTNALLLRPILAEDPDELVALYSRNTALADSFRPFSYPNFTDLRELNDVFSGVLAHDLTAVGLTDDAMTRRLFSEIVSSDYFATFGVQPFQGRFFTAAEEVPESAIPVVVVSHAYWRKNGDPDLLGKTLRINGHAVTVVGIAPRGFTGRTALMSPSLYFPMGMRHLLFSTMFDDRDAPLGDRDNHVLFLVGRLRPGLTMIEANARLADLSARLAEAHPEINENQTIFVGPLRRMGISTRPQADDGLALVAGLLLGMTGIVLLIACINLANMLLAKAATRRQEFAIRAAIGGGRGRILRQLLTEGLMLSALGGVGGLLVAFWATRAMAASLNELLGRNSLGMDILVHAGPDGRVLLATAGFCLVATLLFGFGPAWRQSRPDVIDDLKGQAGDSAPRRRRGRLARHDLLAVSQIALSLVLLTAAGLFIRGAREAADVDPGFDLSRGLLVEVDPSLAGYDEPRAREMYRELQERLESIPGVQAVSVAATVPFGSVSSGRLVRRAEDLPGGGADGSDEIPTVSATSNVIGADYFAALGMEVIRGRAFTRAEAETNTDAAVAIIDEALAQRLWPDRDPVGRRIGFGRTRDGVELEVVGVVPTMLDDLFASESQPHVYVSFGPNFQSGMNVHVRTVPMDAAARGATLQAVRSEITAVDSQMPIMNLKTLDHHIAESASLWIVRLGANIFTTFGALALFLAVVGVYGVKAYAVAQRTREIGIRKSLGATTRDTLWLVLREGMVLTTVGLGIGLLLAAGVARLLGNMLYGVSALDPVTFLVAPLILAVAALLATWLPARRASRVAPITALRSG